MGVSKWPGRCFALMACAAWTLAAERAVALEKQATGLKARHVAGQTILTWSEVDPRVTQDSIPARQLQEIRRDLNNRKGTGYRIYRSMRVCTVSSSSLHHQGEPVDITRCPAGARSNGTELQRWVNVECQYAFRLSVAIEKACLQELERPCTYLFAGFAYQEDTARQFMPNLGENPH